MKKKLSVQVEQEMIDELDSICFQENKTRSHLVREILANFLGCFR
jgi:metal-responsive CopG/Arc/MetJ family transcriptional regulator